MLPSIATALVAGSPDAILIADPDGHYVDANPAALELLGYEREELQSLSVGDVVAAGPIWSTNEYARFLYEGAWQGEVELRTKNGRVVPAEARALVIPSHEGSLYAALLRDITERKAADAANARLAALVHSSADAIMSLSLEGIITEWNPAAARLYGYSAEDAIGQPAAMLAPPERAHEIEQFLTRLRAGETLHGVETVRRTKDGHPIAVSLTSAPIHDAAGEVVGSSSIVRDITQRKLVQEELQAALVGAQEANRAKGIFLDLMSHELRTPLQAVLGYSEFLLSRPKTSLTAEQRADIDYIARAGQRMIALVNQALDLSRMDASRITLATEPLDLVQIIEAVRQDVSPQAAAKALVVDIELPTSLPTVMGDAERVRQILLNLVGNAVKFTDAGRVRIAVAEHASGGVEVEVNDTGVGIAADALLHIFEPFHQVESGATHRRSESGLGLAIAGRLADQMGGDIDVTSEPNVGSTFRLHLPGG